MILSENSTFELSPSWGSLRLGIRFPDIAILLSNPASNYLQSFRNGIAQLQS